MRSVDDSFTTADIAKHDAIMKVKAPAIKAMKQYL